MVSANFLLNFVLANLLFLWKQMTSLLETLDRSLYFSIFFQKSHLINYTSQWESNRLFYIGFGISAMLVLKTSETSTDPCGNSFLSFLEDLMLITMIIWKTWSLSILSGVLLVGKELYEEACISCPLGILYRQPLRVHKFCWDF